MESGKHNRIRIDSLQALRTLAFLGIFLSHAGVEMSWPKLGVSVFFVMSGFLMAYRYNETELRVSVKENICFSLNKIRKLYPLHILTMIFAVILCIQDIIENREGIRAIIILIGKIVLNVTLLQAWIPHSGINVTLNGVAWYLSVTVFLYFMFPWINRFINGNTKERLCAICGQILTVEIIACILLIRILSYDNPIYIWFMYCFPVFRLGDFLVGCVLKRVYFERSTDGMRTTGATISEVAAVIITVVISVWFRRTHTNIINSALHNWTTVFIPLACVWVYLFTAKNGLLTGAVTNRLSLYVGDLSAYAFLIHYVVIQYTNRMMTYSELSVIGWGRAVLILTEFIITIALSDVYKRVHNKKITEGFLRKTEESQIETKVG